jgi:hypothetical protein
MQGRAGLTKLGCHCVYLVPPGSQPLMAEPGLFQLFFRHIDRLLGRLHLIMRYLTGKLHLFKTLAIYRARLGQFFEPSRITRRLIRIGSCRGLLQPGI